MVKAKRVGQTFKDTKAARRAYERYLKETPEDEDVYEFLHWLYSPARPGDLLPSGAEDANRNIDLIDDLDEAYDKYVEGHWKDESDKIYFDDWLYMIRCANTLSKY